MGQLAVSKTHAYSCARRIFRKDVATGLAELCHEGERSRASVMDHKQGCPSSRPGDSCLRGRDCPAQSAACTLPVGGQALKSSLPITSHTLRGKDCLCEGICRAAQREAPFSDSGKVGM